MGAFKKSKIAPELLKSGAAAPCTNNPRLPSPVHTLTAASFFLRARKVPALSMLVEVQVRFQKFHSLWL